MHLPWRDVLATLLVAASVVVYAMWVAGSPILGFGDVPAVAAVVLVLGVVASMAAVVPAFAELLRGSRAYMAVASVLGLVALGAGLWAFLGREAIGLAILVIAALVLWAMSTLRHLGFGFGQPQLGDL